MAHPPPCRRTHRRRELWPRRSRHRPLDPAHGLPPYLRPGRRLRHRQPRRPLPLLRRRLQEPRPLPDAPARVRPAHCQALDRGNRSLPAHRQPRHAPRLRQGDLAGDIQDARSPERHHRLRPPHLPRRDPLRAAAGACGPLGQAKCPARDRRDSRPEPRPGERADRGSARPRDPVGGRFARSRRPRRPVGPPVGLERPRWLPSSR